MTRSPLLTRRIYCRHTNFRPSQALKCCFSSSPKRVSSTLSQLPNFSPSSLSLRARILFKPVSTRRTAVYRHLCLSVKLSAVPLLCPCLHTSEAHLLVQPMSRAASVSQAGKMMKMSKMQMRCRSTGRRGKEDARPAVPVQVRPTMLHPTQIMPTAPRLHQVARINHPLRYLRRLFSHLPRLLTCVVNLFHPTNLHLRPHLPLH